MAVGVGVGAWDKPSFLNCQISYPRTTHQHLLAQALDAGDPRWAFPSGMEGTEFIRHPNM